MLHYFAEYYTNLQCVTLLCRVLHYFAGCCTTLLGATYSAGCYTPLCWLSTLLCLSVTTLYFAGCYTALLCWGTCFIIIFSQKKIRIVSYSIISQLIPLLLCYLQGGAVIRAARRMAEKVGYDQETGLHLEAAPPTPRKELHVLQDGTYNQVNGLLSMMHHGYRIKNISQKGVGHRKYGPPLSRFIL